MHYGNDKWHTSLLTCGTTFILKSFTTFLAFYYFFSFLSFLFILTHRVFIFYVSLPFFCFYLFHLLWNCVPSVSHIWHSLISFGLWYSVVAISTVIGFSSFSCLANSINRMFKHQVKIFSYFCMHGCFDL